MLLGKIFGKVTTKEFKFLVEHETRKFDYIQVYHPVYDYVLCQVLEIEKQEEMTTAHCQVIGFKDKDGKIKKLRIPFEPGSEVFIAEDKFIAQVIQLEDDSTGAYIGKLDGKDIKIYLDLKKLLTKHVAILAKSGSGKSYTVGVLLEEIIDKKVPLLIIDPHGEYSSMGSPNNNKNELDLMPYFDVKPEKFNVVEYGDTKINTRARPLRISNKLSSKELIDMLPVKLSASQMGVLYSATQSMGDSSDFESILYALQSEESNAKWNVISVIEQLKDIGLFSDAPTSYHELIKSGTCTVLNFRGINPEIQDIIVYKICKDLFELRKQNKLPPFFMVVEEAHNYCPERSFGEKKSSKILRTIASEGRKFGLGLCIVSQRPARVDKSVLSQCSTQIIMKVTNPNDLKAISSSVEGITSTTEKEIQDLNIGTSLITGVTDVPLFVKIRPRKSLHGGQAVDILAGFNESIPSEEDSMLDKLESFNEQEVLPLIKPNTSVKDVMLMSERPINSIHNILIPVLLVACSEGDDKYDMLVDARNGEIITDKESFCVDQNTSSKQLPNLDRLSKKELQILQIAFQLKQFSTIDIVHQIGSNLDVESELNVLLEKNYLVKTDSGFSLSNNYILNKLSNYKVFENVVYEQINYSQKVEETKNIDDIMTTLQKFTDVLDYSKSYLLVYDINYK